MHTFVDCVFIIATGFALLSIGDIELPVKAPLLRTLLCFLVAGLAYAARVEFSQ